MSTISLALTDGLLLAVCIWISTNRHQLIAVRLSSFILGVAALLGVLRFSGVYPLLPWHQFFSLMGAVSALPLLCIASVMPNGLVAQNPRFAWIFMGLTAVIGLMVAGLAQLRLYADALAVLSILIPLIYLLLHKAWLGALGALILLSGLLLFARKFSIAPWLLPADFLHIGMALGLLLMAQQLTAGQKTPRSSA